MYITRQYLALHHSCCICPAVIVSSGPNMSVWTPGIWKPWSGEIPLDSTCFSTKQLWIPHGSTIVTQFDTPFCISNAIRHPDNPKKGHSSTHMRPHHSALHISRGSVRGRCRCKQKLRCHCSQLDKTSENSTGGSSNMAAGKSPNDSWIHGHWNGKIWGNHRTKGIVPLAMFDYQRVITLYIHKWQSEATLEIAMLP